VGSSCAASDSGESRPAAVVHCSSVAGDAGVHLTADEEMIDDYDVQEDNNKEEGMMMDNRLVSILPSGSLVRSSSCEAAIVSAGVQLSTQHH
jgi:hypothetical protein